MLTVTNFGAACCVIEGGGVRILCDPWFTDGIYLGAWVRECYIPDPVKAIGEVSHIWISHQHEDHFDPVFLKLYLTAYPNAILVISARNKALERMMQRDGFKPITCDCFAVSKMLVYIVPNNGYPNEIENIDSALVVIDDDSAVVNMTDCPMDEEQIWEINRRTAGHHITALLPYSGAGPWPQCYVMSSSAKRTAAKDKKRFYLKQFERYRVALHADVVVPFSAGYRLCASLDHLNDMRGIAEQSEVPNATILPTPGMFGPGVAQGFAWESDPYPSDADLMRLINEAEARAPKVAGEPLAVGISIGPIIRWLFCTETHDGRPLHETIHMDPRLLKGLLTRKWHFNAAEISSVLRIERHGAAYERRVFDYLFGFHI